MEARLVSTPNQRAFKNGAGIKSCLIGPPEAPPVFILLPDWQVKQ
jgi:hypothetical protein